MTQVFIKIQENTGANAFRIQLETPYITDHEELVELTWKEQQPRLKMKDTIGNFDGYHTCFYPNWKGDIPMVLYMFFDTDDLPGKTIVFHTYGGAFSIPIGL